MVWLLIFDLPVGVHYHMCLTRKIRVVPYRDAPSSGSIEISLIQRNNCATDSFNLRAYSRHSYNHH